MKPSKHVFVSTMVLANVLTVLLVGPSTNACDTWLAMHDATEDGSVLLGKNSDRPPMEAQPLVLFPRTRHASGDRVKCTYIEIPQVDQTYGVRSIFDRTEQWEMQRQKKVESQAAKLIQQGEETAATQLVQQFVDENCERVKKEYEMLNNTLPRILQRVGTEYVFLDYLKEWTSRKAVPLPVSQP